jgi:FMN phosphatase YigB (HAD superfamily)
MRHDWSTVGSLDEVNLDGVEAVAADVDHTLFDFDPAHEAAVKAVSAEISARLGAALGTMFDLVLEGSRVPDDAPWDRRAEFNALLAAIAGFQPWADPRHPRKWARPSWIQVINERERLGMNTDDIAHASDRYWDVLAMSGGLYRDVRGFLKRLEKRGIPLVLMTASDSVLLPKDGGFAYDPDHARRKKLARLDRLGIPYASAVVGDPHDKPSARFYDRLDDAVYAAGAATVGRAVAIGDSLRGDVQPPAERGYRACHLRRPA